MRFVQSPNEHFCHDGSWLHIHLCMNAYVCVCACFIKERNCVMLNDCHSWSKWSPLEFGFHFLCYLKSKVCKSEPKSENGSHNKCSNDEPGENEWCSKHQCTLNDGNTCSWFFSNRIKVRNAAECFFLLMGLEITCNGKNTTERSGSETTKYGQRYGRGASQRVNERLKQ